MDGGEERKDRRERKTETDKILAFQEMMCVHRDINRTTKHVLLIHELEVQDSRWPKTAGALWVPPESAARLVQSWWWLISFRSEAQLEKEKEKEEVLCTKVNVEKTSLFLLHRHFLGNYWVPFLSDCQRPLICCHLVTTHISEASGRKYYLWRCQSLAAITTVSQKCCSLWRRERRSREERRDRKGGREEQKERTKEGGKVEGGEMEEWCWKER